ncbi:MAG: DUF2497 domain-containing protein [Rickettsiales bacterium]|nr:DUF2497 domain-containing protein [Rickettsiales bacterium]
MKEKSTISILENIKKKMQKLDQNSKKVTTFQGDDEFEYITPIKQNIDEIQETEKPQEIKNVDSTTKMEDSAKSSSIEVANNAAQINSSNSQTIANAKENKVATEASKNEQALDDFGLDDLSDLEEELKLEKNKIKNNSLNQAQDLQNSDQKIDSEIAKEVKNDSNKPNENLDPNPQKQPISDAKEDKEKKFLQDLDDIDLDELLKEEEVQKSQQKPLDPKPLDQNLEDDDDKFLQDLKLPELKSLSQSSNTQPINLKSFAENNNFHQSEVAKTEAAKVENTELESAKSEITKVDNIQEYDDQNFKKESRRELPTLSISEVLLSKPEEALTQAPKNFAELESNMNQQSEELSQSNQTMIDQIEDSNSVKVLPEIFTTEVLPNNLEKTLPTTDISKITMQMLEPKLQAWFDEHLQSLVEKIVQEEVRKLFEKNK